MGEYKIGTTYATLASASTKFGSVGYPKQPRGAYSPGTRRQMLSGNMRYSGFARATWHLAPTLLTNWTKTKANLEYQYSGEMWIQTHDDDNLWFNARCILNMPEPHELERAGGKYVAPILEFTILERWDLIPFSFHEGGTLAANQTYYIKLPNAWKFYGAEAGASNNSDATLAASGAIAGTLFSATAIGDSGSLTYIQPASSPVDIAANELVTLTLDFDGSAGTAAQNVSIIVVAAASL